MGFCPLPQHIGTHTFTVKPENEISPSPQTPNPLSLYASRHRHCTNPPRFPSHAWRGTVDMSKPLCTPLVTATTAGTNATRGVPPGGMPPRSAKTGLVPRYLRLQCGTLERSAVLRLIRVVCVAHQKVLQSCVRRRSCFRIISRGKFLSTVTKNVFHRRFTGCRSRHTGRKFLFTKHYGYGRRPIHKHVHRGKRYSYWSARCFQLLA